MSTVYRLMLHALTMKRGISTHHGSGQLSVIKPFGTIARLIYGGYQFEAFPTRAAAEIAAPESVAKKVYPVVIIGAGPIGLAAGG